METGTGAGLAVHAAIGASGPRHAPEQLALGTVWPGHIDGPAFRRKRRSYKTEQLIAYLQSKGKLPAEILADLIRQGWRKLQKDLHCTPLEAFDRWLAMQQALLPYTAAKLATLELRGGADLGAGAGALHLLAAQALAGQITELRDGRDSLQRPLDLGESLSGDLAPDHESGAPQKTQQYQRVANGLPVALPDAVPLE